MSFWELFKKKQKSEEPNSLQPAKSFVNTGLTGDEDIDKAGNMDDRDIDALFIEARKQLFEPLFSVSFDGENISENNYYETAWNRRGLFFGTGHCGVLHLFIPNKTSNNIAAHNILSEINKTQYVIASVCEKEERGMYLELLFEDNSSSPFVIYLSGEQINPKLSNEDDNTTDLKIQIHVGPTGAKAKEFPMWMRFVDYLPYTKPWGQ